MFVFGGLFGFILTLVLVCLTYWLFPNNLKEGEHGTSSQDSAEYWRIRYLEKDDAFDELQLDLQIAEANWQTLEKEIKNRSELEKAVIVFSDFIKNVK